MRYSPVVLLALAVSSNVARADRKSFAHTYEYATLPEGQTEIELWHSQLRDSWQAQSAPRFEEKPAIEHGITDHLDIAVDPIFHQLASSDPLVPAPTPRL